MRVLLVGLGVIAGMLFTVSSVFSDPPALENLQKTRLDYTVDLKTYQISPTESISLYGIRLKKFITDTWYWGEGGYGALFGKRSGYLEGGVFTGIEFPLTGDVIADCRIFTGAGGGGSAPQGGGFIINPTIGVSYPIAHHMAIGTELGYIHFINGDISSWTFAVNLSIKQWSLSYL